LHVVSKLNEVANYWRSIASANGMPRRRDLDPTKIRKYLPNIVISERVGKKQVIIRFAGTIVLDMAKRELKGLEILQMVPDDSRAFTNWLYQTTSDTPCAVLIERKLHTQGLFYPTSSFILPFTGDDALHPHYLMLVEYGELMRRWGQTEELIVQPISQYQFFDLGFGIPEGRALRPLPDTTTA
jgi:hypothetical protein